MDVPAMTVKRVATTCRFTWEDDTADDHVCMLPEGHVGVHECDVDDECDSTYFDPPPLVSYPFEKVVHGMAEAAVARIWSDYDPSEGGTREDWQEARDGMLAAYEDDMAEALCVLVRLGLLDYTDDEDGLKPGENYGRGSER